jgi:hypothetical protein
MIPGPIWKRPCYILFIDAIVPTIETYENRTVTPISISNNSVQSTVTNNNYIQPTVIDLIPIMPAVIGWLKWLFNQVVK